ncbi:MAG: hypothetical protein WAM14_13970 [Candidatus Nitrosopolaris sp.]
MTRNIITKRDDVIARLNFFYESIFENDIAMNSLDSRIKLQKLVYILKSEGIDFGYNFTWYIRGPYSSDLADDGFYLTKRRVQTLSSPYDKTNEDQVVLDKLAKVKHIIKNSNTAELVASYLFLQPNYGANTTNEQMTRKPRFIENQIREVMNEWHKATGTNMES